MIDDLWALEEGFFTDRHTPELVDRTVADNAIVAFEHGRMTKADWMAAVSKPTTPSPFVMSNREALTISDTVVLLNYIAIRLPAGKEPDVRAMSTIWA